MISIFSALHLPVCWIVILISTPKTINTYRSFFGFQHNARKEMSSVIADMLSVSCVVLVAMVWCTGEVKVIPRSRTEWIHVISYSQGRRDCILRTPQSLRCLFTEQFKLVFFIWYGIKGMYLSTVEFSRRPRLPGHVLSWSVKKTSSWVFTI